MRTLIICAVGLLGLWSCGADATPEDSSEDNITEATRALPHDISETETVSFQDVLNQYRTLNTRLDNTAYRILSANADLCPQTSRSLGMTVHTELDYPGNLRDLARDMLSVSDIVTVRTVWDGSPAHTAGIEVGDQVLKLAGHGLPIGPTAKRLYDAIAAQSLNPSTVDITVRRNNNLIDLQIQPETLCSYSALVIYSEHINAITDGETIFLTSELIRKTTNDAHLAMFFAHELGHAISDHVNEDTSQALELEADRMALILMARAGFDIEATIETWGEAPHPHMPENGVASTHPTLAQRLENLENIKAEILKKQALGQSLGLD